MPSKSLTSTGWEWFARKVKYSKKDARHEEHRYANIVALKVSPIGPAKASVVHRDNAQESKSMAALINKKHSGEEASIQCVAPSPGDSRGYEGQQSAICFSGCHARAKLQRKRRLISSFWPMPSRKRAVSSRIGAQQSVARSLCSIHR